MIREEYSCEIDYDDEFDFLSFTWPGFKSSGSVVAGPFTIDLYKNTLVGIEIEGAKELLKDVFGKTTAKINNAKIGFQEKNNALFIILAMDYKNEHLQQKVLAPKAQPMPILA